MNKLLKTLTADMDAAPNLHHGIMSPNIEPRPNDRL